MNELHLFAGAGGGILGGLLLGHRPVCAVEIEPYPRKVLLQRQRDGLLPRFPIWDDIQTFDGKPWRGQVDVVCGGFPCQDISAAGKGAGIEGERSGLWGEMARVIGEIRPKHVYVENSPMLVVRGLGRVLGDLSEMGYNAKWTIMGADEVGAPHRRKRIWILATDADSYGAQRRESEQTRRNSRTNALGQNLADADSGGRRKEGQRRGLEEISGGGANERLPIKESDLGDTDCLDGRTGEVLDDLADAMCNRLQGSGEDREVKGSTRLCDGARSDEKQSLCNSTIERFPNRTEEPLGESGQEQELERSNWWVVEPNVGRVAHGVASRVDRLKAIGNGQVSAVAAAAWRILIKE